jgi:hypothetical protein
MWLLAGERAEEEVEGAVGACGGRRRSLGSARVERGGEELSAGTTPHARTPRRQASDAERPIPPCWAAGCGRQPSRRAGLPAGRLAPHLPWPPQIPSFRVVGELVSAAPAVAAANHVVSLCWRDVQERDPCQFFNVTGKGGWWTRRVRSWVDTGWVTKQLCFWHKHSPNCDFYGRFTFFVIMQPDGWVRCEV